MNQLITAILTVVIMQIRLVMQIICREPEELLKILIIAFNPYPANIFVLKITGLDKQNF